MNVDLDYYRVLEVGTGATEREIKKAYHKKALACHPDRGGTERQMKTVNEAWAVLGDAAARREYDSERALSRLPEVATKKVVPREEVQRTFISDLFVVFMRLAFWIGRGVRWIFYRD